MSLYNDLKELDVNDFASWSRPVKLFMAFMFSIIILVVTWFSIIQGQRILLQSAQDKEQALKREFKQKKALAINLDAYKQQMTEAEETFNVLLGQLPNESEVPDLLIDITQAGISRGLQFEQIKPGDTISKDFYAEKIVNIKVKGNYFQVASFISDISALPRIINVDNFVLKRLGSKKEDSNLSLNAVLKTYHYFSEDEQIIEE